MDELNLEVEDTASSEGTTAEEATPEPADAGETEPESESSQEGTTTEESDSEGDADAQAESDRQATAYRDMQGRADRAERENQQFRAQEQQRQAAKFKDEDSHVDRISTTQGFQEAVAFHVAQGLSQMDATHQAQQTQIAAMEAGNRTRDFALTEAGWTEAKYNSFLAENAGPNGIPFEGFHPQQAEKMAQAMIRDAEQPHFAAKQQGAADKKADLQAQRKLKNAVPSGAPVRADGTPKTQDETYRDGIRETVKVSDPGQWFKV